MSIAIEAPPEVVISGADELGKIAAELRRQLDTKADYVADTRRIGFHCEDNVIPGPTLTIDDVEGEFRINDYALGQIAGHLGIPVRLVRRFRDDHPDILGDVVTKLFNREPATKMVRTLDGNARAFLSDKFRRLDHYDLLDRAILPALAETRMEIKSAAVTDLRLHIKAVFPDLVADVREGDTVFAGIGIFNSEVGAGALSVEPWIWRLVCANGMIAPVAMADFGLRKMHVGRRIEETEAARAVFSERTIALDDEAFFATVGDVVRGAATGVRFAEMVNRMRDLAGLRVDGDPVAAVERLRDAHDLSETEGGSILAHLIEGGDLSAWGYLNAVTRSAQDAPGYDRRTEIERVGGALLAAPSASWAALAA